MIKLFKQRPAHGMDYTKTEDFDPKSYFLSLVKSWSLRLIYSLSLVFLLVFFLSFFLTG